MVFACFLVDSILSVLFPGNFGGGLYFVPCVGFCALILNIRHMELTDALLLSAFAGMFYDFFYANTLFLYFLLFCVMCFLTRLWILVMNESLLENVVLCISTIFVREFMVYVIMYTGNRTSMTFQVWMQDRIFLTLIVNAVLVFILVLISYLVEDYLHQRELRIRKEERLPWMF